MHIRDPLSRPVIECFQLPMVEHVFQIAALQSGQPAAYLRIVRGRIGAARSGSPFGRREGAAVPVGQRQKVCKISRRIRAPPDGKKIDELHEQARFAVARAPHDLDQLPEPRQESLIPDPQQRPARHIANSGRLDDDGSRPARGESLVPIEHVLGHKAGVRRAPRHHGGDPGSVAQGDGTDLNRRKQQRPGSLLGAGPPSRPRIVPDALGRAPHRQTASGNTAVASISTRASFSIRATTCTTDIGG
jgi:hypothetical protein